MAKKLEELIEETNGADDEKITCVVVDQGMGSALEIAAKMGIHQASFCHMVITKMALLLSIPNLINDGIISNEDIIPIGPLLASNRLGNSIGNFWPEDPTCLKWLDQQPPCSIIYVVFGSLTIFNKQQFQELAMGLELSNRPFLWIVQSYSTDSRNDVYPKGFLERIGT
ncbi:UDP-glycosyltransferase 83A1-like [Vitis vinifera]|uniref:UDP-glycosyltransferase 83A1-like n=1 Tax=Vitis vinifera TaxID=29760 RepID=UPI0008FEBC00|nr:UDP-glycosyltransferase 83A1-like [Vitis vinifera]|eukprot:XP_019078095.1 PREDICTED: UDP-glycosyltransferase 83A1-like [Vitis vinifera]